MPSPLLGTDAATQPSARVGSVDTSTLLPNRHESALADWTTPLLRVSLEDIVGGQLRTPVTLIAPDNTRLLPNPAGK